MEVLGLTHGIAQKDSSSGWAVQTQNGKEVAWDNLAKKEEAIPQYN